MILCRVDKQSFKTTLYRFSTQVLNVLFLAIVRKVVRREHVGVLVTVTCDGNMLHHQLITCPGANCGNDNACNDLVPTTCSSGACGGLGALCASNEQCGEGSCPSGSGICGGLGSSTHFHLFLQLSNAELYRGRVHIW